MTESRPTTAPAASPTPAEELAGLLPTFAVSPAHQVAQLRSRQLVVAGWPSLAGRRVLEIGCGQGDMTVVLADAVGPAGLVVGTDPAPPTYGAPVDIGTSTAGLAASPLGRRMRFHLGHDVVTDGLPPVDGPGFDVVVMSHMSWYVGSTGELVVLLRAARAAAPVLLLSEWDPRPTRDGQWPHLLALTAQQLLSDDLRAVANVRTPLTRAAMRAAVTTAGWSVTGDVDVDTTDRQDGRWEVDMVLAGLTGPSSRTSGVSPAADLAAQLTVEGLSAAGDVVSLGSYALTARAGSDPLTAGRT